MLKKCWKGFCFALVLAALPACPAQADETVRVDHEPVATDAAWVDGEMSFNEYHYYPLAIEQVGKLSVRAQCFYGGASFDLLDGDLVCIGDTLYLNGSRGEPETGDFEYYLEPGQYYVRNNGSAGASGAYRIKAAFAPCSSDETPENDDYRGAQALASGVQVSGVLTQRDAFDYYSFAIPEKQSVRLVVNSEAEHQQMLTLYDGDLVEVETVYALRGYAGELELPAGSYYLALKNAQGPYTLKLIY